MKEYTLLSLAAVIAGLLIDWRLKTFVFRKRSFLIFWPIIFAFMLLVNGYLTWRPIVLYNSEFFMGARLFTIPYEDFFYGFSLIYFNLIIWEYGKKNEKKSSSNR